MWHLMTPSLRRHGSSARELLKSLCEQNIGLWDATDVDNVLESWADKSSIDFNDFLSCSAAVSCRVRAALVQLGCEMMLEEGIQNSRLSSKFPGVGKTDDCTETVLGRSQHIAAIRSQKCACMAFHYFLHREVFLTMSSLRIGHALAQQCTVTGV